MDFVTIRRIKKVPKLTQPLLIEGLPGIGNVGKLAVEHLIDSIKATKFAEFYCKDFPPQVFINSDGTIELVKNEFYYCKSQKKNQRDLLLLTGDYQGLSSQGQYELVDQILNLCATTDKSFVKEMKKHGAVFKKNEPGGGIVGASGLILGLGKLRGMKGACFMGETPGYLVDPKSAKAVLHVLMSITNIEVDLSALEDKAKEIEQIAQQLKEMETTTRDKPEDLKYIG